MRGDRDFTTDVIDSQVRNAVTPYLWITLQVASVIQDYIKQTGSLFCAENSAVYFNLIDCLQILKRSRGAAKLYCNLFIRDTCPKPEYGREL